MDLQNTIGLLWVFSFKIESSKKEKQKKFRKKEIMYLGAA